MKQPDAGGHGEAALLERLPGLFWTCRADGGVEFVGPQLARFTGRRAEELEGRGWEACVHEDDRALVEGARTRALAAAGPWRAVFRLRAADGQCRWIDARAAPDLDESGRVASWAVAAVEVDPAEHEALAGEARFRALFNSMEEGFQLCELVRDEHGRANDYRFLEVNPAFERHSGLSRDRVIGRTIREILPDVEQHWIDMYVDVAQTGRARRCENYAAAVGRWYDVYAFRPAPGQFASVSLDVTEHRLAEDALRRTNEELRVSEERFRLLSVATHDVIWDWDLVRGALGWNEAVEDAFGYPRREVPADLGWWREHVHPDDRERVTSQLQAALAEPGRHVWQGEYRFRRRDGRWVDVFDRGYIARDASGRAVRMIGSMLDLSERKRAEEALRRSQEEFRSVAEAMPQLVWTASPEGRIEYCNRQWFDYTGLTVEQAQSDGWARTLHPDDLAPTLERWHRCLATGETYETEYRLRSARDGAYRWFLARALPVRDGAGRLVRWFGTCTDIEAHKRVEGELAEAKARLEVILANLPAGVFISDAAGRIVQANERARSIWGGLLPAERPADYAGYRGYWPDSGRPLRADEWGLARAVTRGETVVGQVVDIRRFDGGTGTILNTAAPFRDREGRVTGAVVVLQDITELKRAQTALRESEARARERYADLEQTYRHAPVGLVTLDRDGRYLRVNQTLAEMNGRSVEEHIGRTMEQVVPHLAPWLRRLLRPVLERGEPILDAELHGSTRAAPGVERDWIGNFHPLRSGSGEVVGLTGAVLEVTERKRAERALRESEERFRTLADNIAQLAWMTAPDGATTWYNKRWYDYTGTAPEEVKGWGWQKLHHPEHRARVVQKLRDCFRRGVEWEDTFPLRGRDGRYRWFLSRAIPIRDEAGRVLRWFGTNTDVTEQRLVEAALRESEELARTSLDAASLGTWRQDFLAGDVRFDERGAEHYGFPGRRATLDEVLARVHPDDRERLAEAVRRTLAPDSSGRCGVEYRVVHPDGATRWLAVQARVVFEGQGARRRPAVGIGTSMDITERKQAEARLREANEQLRQADRRKNEFLAVLSHELRNPLAPMRNSLYILDRATPGGQQARRAHQVIGRQVAHMTRLIEDLLDVTRVSRGKIHLQRERVELCDLVQRTAEDHRSLLSASGVRLEVEACDGPVFVDGDPTRLAQIVGNLLGNAAKFTHAGGRVDLSLRAAGDAAEIRVKDNGAGLAPELAERLFEPFVQAESTLARSKGGLGLGLALVKGLVELHGGTVAARSEGPGRGAEFLVRIPVCAAEAARPRPGECSEGRRPGKALRVLVIEDNADAAESLREALELNGHEVELARTGDEGLEKARASRPDAVLCDIGLPGMDGFEVARRMRADPRLGGAPLVALSGYAAPEDVQRAKDAGFARHLAKPPDLDVLESALAELGGGAGPGR